ncbi:hypothetical protein [Ruminococcus flavefaciens]|uniref:hypothetical protein n=1 Tax=Ruminococcus flavefaciens TaxID=1265 RepID=UPI0026EEADAE|nr:hypothetical protein [Ruminococcus flavefaciens]
MNTIDIILIAVIAAAFIAAVAVCIRNKKHGKGCGGCCVDCSACCRDMQHK